MKTIAFSLLLGAAALGLAPAAAVQAQTHHKDAAEDAARPANLRRRERQHGADDRRARSDVDI
jgi:hypothetical protein